jgi:putative transposase
MRESGFTESQIVAILKEGEAGVALSELTRKHGISRAIYFKWQAKYGGVSVSELKRMKGLEAENAKNSGADIKMARRFSASPTRQASGPRTCTASCKPQGVLRPRNAVVHREY